MSDFGRESQKILSIISNIIDRVPAPTTVTTLSGVPNDSNAPYGITQNTLDAMRRELAAPSVFNLAPRPSVPTSAPSPITPSSLQLPNRVEPSSEQEQIHELMARLKSKDPLAMQEALSLLQSTSADTQQGNQPGTHSHPQSSNLPSPGLSSDTIGSSFGRVDTPRSSVPSGISADDILRESVPPSQPLTPENLALLPAGESDQDPKVGADDDNVSVVSSTDSRDSMGTRRSV